jgi:regulator of protease activity HflC (stomatin/prohibitin superfamily)
MADLLLKLIDHLAAIVPLRIVRHWERGVYLVAGKHRGTVGPGLKLVIPGICEIIRVAVTPEVYTTPLQTITLRDGSALTFSASAVVIVTDAAKAYLELGHYIETVQELVAAILSEGLADAEPERFDPARGKRDRLLDEQRRKINAELDRYGLRVESLRLNNFARGVRTVRLLLDRAVLYGGAPGV